MPGAARLADCAMNINFISALHLLHEAAYGSLATQSIPMPGYPFTSVLPFAVDERHRPLFLLSRLAEHTKNLTADGRASFMVHGAIGMDVLAGERVSLLGEVEQIQASPELAERYLRYQPEAEQYIGLGDFAFFRFSPRRARYIAGFGKMGWIEEAEWDGMAVLPLAAESELIKTLREVQSPGERLLGLDCYGIDIGHQSQRKRQYFPEAPLAAERVGQTAHQFLTAQ
jgi:heme iron utilization protein